MTDPADTHLNYRVAVRIANCEEDWGQGEGVIGECDITVTIPHEYAGRRLNSDFTQYQIADIIRDKTEEYLFAGGKPLLEIVAERIK